MQNSTRNCPAQSGRKQQLFLVFYYLGQIDIQLLFSIYLSLSQYCHLEKQGGTAFNFPAVSSVSHGLRARPKRVCFHVSVVHISAGWNIFFVKKDKWSEFILLISY